MNKQSQGKGVLQKFKEPKPVRKRNKQKKIVSVATTVPVQYRIIHRAAELKIRRKVRG